MQKSQQVTGLISAILLMLVSTSFGQISSSVNPENIRQAIKVLRTGYVPEAEVGIIVRDASTGELLINHRGYRRYSIASSSKLFTAVAAVWALGKDFRYTTRLAINPSQLKHSLLSGKLIWQFTGDPSLRFEDLRQLGKQIKRAGIKTIAGDIELDLHHFSKPDYPAGTAYDDLGWYYAAPINAVIINENSEAYYFSAAKKLRLPIKITPSKQHAHWLTLTNHVRTVSAKFRAAFCGLHIQTIQANHLLLYGCQVIAKHNQFERLAFSDPVLIAKRMIKTILKENGIVLKGKITQTLRAITLDKNPFKIIAQHQSPPLAALLKHLLKTSDNTYANSLIKTMAWEKFHIGSFKRGIFTLKDTLKKHSNLDVEQLKMADGAGSRYNQTSPFIISQLLFLIEHDRLLARVIKPALAQPGQTGSLDNRLQQFNLENQIAAKTGTMHDISAISGYLTTAHGRRVIFSIVINHVNQEIHVAKRFEDQLLERLSEDL